MRRNFIFLFAVLLCATVLVGCGETEKPQTVSETSYVESVEIEYFTDDDGVVHKVSDIDFAEPSYLTDWSSITGIPEDFPMLTEKVSSYTSFAGTVNIKWNIFTDEMLKDVKASLEQWSGITLSESTGENITTYKTEKTDGDYTYTIDLIYQPYADGKTNSDTSETFNQGEIYIYKQKGSVVSAE